ncbi:MAG: hypothetical protein BV458_10325 [Thermoplasmata archaeon M9B2D]|nr:MAG: hypothetical protein BV458_10325 [Thermoplasmata archaeon M9B2D]
MNTNKIFKESVILIITAMFLFTSIAVTANTSNQTEPSCLSSTISQSPSNVKPINLSSKDVLWDNGLPDGKDGLSCWYATGYDRIIVDDFTVSGSDPWQVTGGTYRIVTLGGGTPQVIDGVNVYFFESTGPCQPAMTEYAFVQPSFSASLTGNWYFDRPEILVEVVFDQPIELAATGEWWVCFQTVTTDNSFWLTVKHNINCSVFCDMPDLGYPRWTWGYNVWLDYFDVAYTLTGFTGQVAVPDLECNGQLAWEDVVPGDTVEGTFEVSNAGEAGSLLDWEISEVPDWGTNWTFNPDGGVGLTPEDGAVIVTVSVEAPPEEETEYSGEIVIVNSENPADSCTISVSLVTPYSCSQSTLLMQLLQLLFARFPVLALIFG